MSINQNDGHPSRADHAEMQNDIDADIDTAAMEEEAGIREETRTRVHSGDSDATKSRPRHLFNARTGSYQSKLPPLPEVGFTLRQRPRKAIRNLKNLLPCVLNVFLDSILVVNKHVAFLSGVSDYAFLILVVYTLFFHSSGHTVGKHVQQTFTNVAGAAIGIGWSAFATELGCIANRQANAPEGTSSVGARAACALMLAALAFAAGTIKSRFPRLNLASLLSVFTAIWLIAITVRSQQITPAPFLGMLYAVLFAAGVSLLVTLTIFPQTASKVLAREVVDTLGLASELLLSTLHLFQIRSPKCSTFKQYSDLQERVATLRDLLRERIAQIHPLYDEARYEINFSLFPVETYKAYIELALKLHTTMESRMGLHPTDLPFADDEDKSLYEGGNAGAEQPEYLGSLVDELGRMNLFALNTIRDALAKSSYLKPVTSLELGYGSSSTGGKYRINDFFKDKELQKLRERLDEIIASFRDGIVEALDVALKEDAADGLHAQALFRNKTFKDCLFFTSLIELSREVQSGLATATLLPQVYHGSRRHLWLPASFRSLDALLHSLSMSTDKTEEGTAEDEKEEAEYRVQRAAAGLAEFAEEPLTHVQLRRPNRKSKLFQRIFHKAIHVLCFPPRQIARWWSSPRMHVRRVQWHTYLNLLRHSRHLKHATKLCLGISLLTLPGHLPAESQGFQWFEAAKGPWIAISFLYCLQTSTAATYRDAIFRTAGTFLGAFYALVVQKIAHQNPYALVAVMTFQSAFSNYIIVAHPDYQGVGVVGQLTVPAIIFVPYLGLEYDSVVKLAFVRAQDIEIGIVAALLVNIMIWPYHARVQLVTTCAKATDRLTKLYLSMSRNVLRREYSLTVDTLQQYQHLEDKTRTQLTQAGALLKIVHLETSLLPKPVKKYKNLIKKLNELLELFAGLRAIRQNIPRKLTVVDVLPQRTELVSSILILLHSISHSLHTRSPVPQFLPQPRLALENLITSIEEHIESLVATNKTLQIAPRRASPPSTPTDAGHLSFPSLHGAGHAKRESSTKLGFSFAFALAENEAISEVVQTLDDLVDICKELYGVASFIQQEEVPLVTMPSYLATPARTPTMRSARQSFSGPASPSTPQSPSPQLPHSPRRSVRISFVNSNNILPLSSPSVMNATQNKHN